MCNVTFLGKSLPYPIAQALWGMNNPAVKGSNAPVSTQTEIPQRARVDVAERKLQNWIQFGVWSKARNHKTFWFPPPKACISFWSRFYFSEVLFPPSVAHSFPLTQNYFSSPKYVSACANSSSTLKRHCPKHFSPREAKRIVSDIESFY